MKRIIANQFRRPTGILGRVISAMMKKGNIAEYYKVIPLLDIKKGETIYEIGYGHGLGIDKIIATHDCEIHGIDFSNLMFKEATKRNKKHIDVGRVALDFGDFTTAPVKHNYYNKIFCLNVIYFWKSLEEPFMKINEMLTNDGVFCMYIAHPDMLRSLKFTIDEVFNKYTIEQVVEALKKYGFRDISYTLDRGYFIKCVK